MHFYSRVKFPEKQPIFLKIYSNIVKNISGFEMKFQNLRTINLKVKLYPMSKSNTVNPK